MKGLKGLKSIAVIMLLCSSFTGLSQILQVERQYAPKELLDSHKKTVDSLSKLYKKQVFGYQRSVIMREYLVETFIIFYTVKGETEDSIVWSRELILAPKAAPKSIHEGALPLGAASVFYNSTYIGFIKDGYFTRVTPDDGIFFLTMSKDIRKFIINPAAISKYLSDRYGEYYRGMVN